MYSSDESENALYVVPVRVVLHVPVVPAEADRATRRARGARDRERRATPAPHAAALVGTAAVGGYDSSTGGDS